MRRLIISRPCPDHLACTIYQVTPRRIGPVIHAQTTMAMQRPWRRSDARVPGWRAGLKRALKIIYHKRKYRLTRAPHSATLASPK